VDTRRFALLFSFRLQPEWYHLVSFTFAIWGAYLIRTMLLSLLGMITFFTARRCNLRAILRH
jgi:hypothetical protein